MTHAVACSSIIVCFMSTWTINSTHRFNYDMWGSAERKKRRKGRGNGEACYAKSRSVSVGIGN